MQCASASASARMCPKPCTHFSLERTVNTCTGFRNAGDLHYGQHAQCAARHGTVIAWRFIRAQIAYFVCVLCCIDLFCMRVCARVWTPRMTLAAFETQTHMHSSCRRTPLRRTFPWWRTWSLSSSPRTTSRSSSATELTVLLNPPLANAAHSRSLSLNLSPRPSPNLTLSLILSLSLPQT